VGRDPDNQKDNMADKQDAQLLVQLAQWSTALELDVAMGQILSDDFNPEAASIQDPMIAKLLDFYETVGTLTKHSLLETDLVLDWLWVSGIWEKVAPAARRVREQTGVAELYANFEALAKLQK
jgi:hypothetical protein